MNRRAAMVLVSISAAGAVLCGCRSPAQYRKSADSVAASILNKGTLQYLGRKQRIDISEAEMTLRRKLLLDQKLPYGSPASLGADRLAPMAHWPEKRGAEPGVKVKAAKYDLMKLTLNDALKIAAANSRDYQSQKEDVFRAALALNLERHNFQETFTGFVDSLLSTDLSGDEAVGGDTESFGAGMTKKLETGATFTSHLALDLAKLLTQSHESSYGIAADASVSIPLLRGSGKLVVTENLTQAERNVAYALYRLERYRRTFVVSVASSYFGVLGQLDRVQNQAENYKSLIRSQRREQRLADAGRIAQSDVDEGMQSELTARDQWITARESYQSRLDQFKMTLGLPTDAKIGLDSSELTRLASKVRARLAKSGVESEAEGETGKVPPADAPVILKPPDNSGAGPLEMDPEAAVRIALAHRLDLKTLALQVDDARRAVIIAADAFRPGLTLVGNGSAGASRDLGSATSDNAQLDPGKGRYSLGLNLVLPWDETAHRNAYRNTLIDLNRAVRAYQGQEDQVKLDVRNDLRTLSQTRQSCGIQILAVKLAQRRVASENLLLQAGRAQVRDVLFAQDSLISAQNALTTALEDYRIGELALQRDMGVLDVTPDGLWKEYSPNEQQ